MRRAVLAILLLGSGAAHAASSCTPLAVVPLADRADYLALPARLGGLAVTLLLDTGATAGLVQPEAAHRLGLRAAAAPKRRLHGTGGRGGRVPIVSLPLLQLGTLRITGLHAPVSELPQAPHVRPAVAGLLGADVLSHFQVEIDLPHDRLAFYRAGDCDGVPPWRAEAIEVALHRVGDRLLADVRLDGEQARALLDTGARSIIVGEAAAQRAGARALAQEPGGVAGGTDLHPVIYHWHRFGALAIGTIVLRRPTLTVMPIEEDAPILLGAPFFAMREVWLRYTPPAMFVRTPHRR